MTNPNTNLADRPATIDDLPRILQIEQSAFPKERWASSSSLQQRMQLFPAGTWLGSYGGVIAAFSNGFPIDDLATQEELDPTDELLFTPRGTVWLLRNVAVHQAFQRQGLGKLLVQRQVILARKFGAKQFRFTATSNLAGFYASLGFRILREAEQFHGLPQAVWNLEL